MSRLDELYARLDSFVCKGLCQACCSNIAVAPVERSRMAARGIVPPEIHERPCRHLTYEGLCRVHADRPMVCRLYGATADMRCPHGCKPTITRKEGHELMKAVLTMDLEEA